MTSLRTAAACTWSRQCLEIVAGGVALPVQLVAFEPGRLHKDAFETWGITMPPEIARSTFKRQEEFFHGRLATRYALSTLTPDSRDATSDHGAMHESCVRSLSATPTVGIGSHREPVWPQGIVGSITHCSGLAAAAVARDASLRGLGIDVEHVAGPEACAALMQVAVDAAEIERLHVASRQWPLELLLTTVFSAKESFYKGAFNVVRRFFGFEAARLRFIDLEHNRLGFTLTEALGGPFRAGYPIEIGFETLGTQTVLTHFAW